MFKIFKIISIFIPPQNKCFRGYTGINPCVRACVCVQNIIFCQSAGGGIKSHLVTALVFFFLSFFLKYDFYLNIHKHSVFFLLLVSIVTLSFDLTLYHITPTFNGTLRKTISKKLWKKEKIPESQHFLPFSQCLLSYKRQI